MKKLSELYPIDSNILIKDIKINSKEVEKGDIFVCTMGVTADRHDYIDEAIENGASAIVVSKNIENKSIPIIRVEDTNKELIELAKRLYNFDEDKLKLVGITGTNGKTTVSLIIKNLLGDSCGYMGTNGIISKNFSEKIRNTTPDADRLYKYFERFTNDGCNILSMETSSESFFRNRLDGLYFEVGIITNITSDHLNIHKTLENYVDCKMELLRKVKNNGFSILNTEDKYYDLALENAHGTILTYGTKENATMRLLKVEEKLTGSIITLEYNNKVYVFNSPYLGEINAYNIMASLLACIALGKDIDSLIEKVESLPIISGRMEPIVKREYTVMLDYAHTADAFQKVLPILNKIKKRNLVVVTGSAGGREHEKRGPMGKYILENSDHVIFTMDDPRHESVISIIKDLTKDSTNDNYEIIEDRKHAIYKALDDAREGDVILIAGKGCDNYMAVGDEYLPYSDVEVIESYYQN